MINAYKSRTHRVKNKPNTDNKRRRTHNHTLNQWLTYMWNTTAYQKYIHKNNHKQQQQNKTKHQNTKTEHTQTKKNDCGNTHKRKQNEHTKRQQHNKNMKYKSAQMCRQTTQIKKQKRNAHTK